MYFLMALELFVFFQSPARRLARGPVGEASRDENLRNRVASGAAAIFTQIFETYFHFFFQIDNSRVANGLRKKMIPPNVIR
jgi:hypothetical protein